MILTVKKRDGREMPFNIEKIAGAVEKALRASGELNQWAQEASQQLSLLGKPEDPIANKAFELAVGVVEHL